jgi:hypothetical protein
MYYLPPDSLEGVWASILVAIQQPGFQHFRDVTILLQAKNLKVLTKDATWEQMMSRFHNYWANTIDDKYITADFYFDIRKETCPQQASKVTSSPDKRAVHIDIRGNSLVSAPAETLLYKRYYLKSYASQARHGSTTKETQKQVFYPFSML